ncbi:FAD monooxygenase [Trichoderma cornu-damae]|uniref:FAD monooxygenase n=1 Tax=Trichoderma cornu-damae TaxID=654480 RepID=A0A9P8TYL9_9HYPO|nr:FAD monooxygenase [Trichoderma cornu-damae]
MSSSNSEIEVVDVAIVGGTLPLEFIPHIALADIEILTRHLAIIGGPTGLLTGLLLHRLGVSVSILGTNFSYGAVRVANKTDCGLCVDAKPRSLDFGRADALNARTQQYLTVVGILDELIPQGLKCNTSSTFSNGNFTSRQNKWWISLEHTLHKNFLMVGQPVVERALSSRLGNLVHYGEQVESLTEKNEFVEVVTSSGRNIRSTYALGADGAKSMVRAAMGATFSGTKPEMLWAVLDTFIDTDFPTCAEIITFQLNGQSRVSWIPREGGLCRFYVLLEGEVTQERAQESIKKHLAPYRTDFIKTEWYSTFDGNAGRVFLAGDAAHVHSVNGGQGLNTGIADAFSLAWRLALVLKSPRLQDGAADKLLCSYDMERRQTAQGVIHVAAALVRDTVHTAKKYVGTIERSAGLCGVNKFQVWQRRLIRLPIGMGVAYDAMGSPIVENSEHGVWKAGKRCPDVVLSKPEGDGEIWLYSQVTYGKYLVLAIGNHPEQAHAHADVAVLFNILPSSATLESVLATTSKVGTFTADWADPEESFAVVVRPDMYVGYVGADIESCQQYLDRLFNR